MKILEAKNITKMFPGVIALDSVDVAFEPGEFMQSSEKMEREKVH